MTNFVCLAVYMHYRMVGRWRISCLLWKTWEGKGRTSVEVSQENRALVRGLRVQGKLICNGKKHHNKKMKREWEGHSRQKSVIKRNDINYPKNPKLGLELQLKRSVKITNLDVLKPVLSGILSHSNLTQLIGLIGPISSCLKKTWNSSAFKTLSSEQTWKYHAPWFQTILQSC